MSSPADKGDSATQLPSSPRMGPPSFPASAFFEDAEIRQRLDLLQHVAVSSELSLLVLGEKDIGKTTLLARLLERLADQGDVCRIDAARTPDPATALKTLAKCCDVPTDCGATALQYLLMEHAANALQPSLIVVDDAHLLSPSVLQTLIGLTANGDGRGRTWRLMLFAEPVIDAIIAQMPSAEGKWQRMHLAPLSETRAAAYLRHLWRTASGDDFPFTPEQIARLRHESRGLPGRLAALADAVLQVPSAKERDFSPPPPAIQPKRRTRAYSLKVAGIAALALGLAAVLALQDRINALFQPAQKPGKELVSVSDTATPPLPDITASTRDSETAPPREPTEPPVLAPQKVKPEISLPELSAPSTMMPPKTEPQAAPSPSGAAAPDVPPPPPTETTRPARTASMPDSPNTAMEHSPSGTDAGLADRPAQAQDEIADRNTAVQPKPKTAAKPATAPLEPAAGNSTEPPPSPAVAWILKQNPQHYTVQLQASFEPAPLNNTTKRYHLGEAARHYRVDYKGKDWYVLIYGRFDHFEQARQAVQRLPKAIRKQQPWIRPFKAVQNEIRHGKK